MTDRFKSFDAALVAAVNAGAVTFGALHAHGTLLGEASALAVP